MSPSVIQQQNITKNQQECRYCKCSELTRIPRGGIVKTLFPFLPLSHFICYRCFKKQYKRRA